MAPSRSFLRGIYLLLTIIGLMSAGPQRVIAQETYIATTNLPASFPMVRGTDAAAICVDAKDWPGVVRAAHDLDSDINRVTGRTPVFVANTNEASGNVIIIGTLGRSSVIDQLAKDGKIDASAISGKWESFLIQVVPNPLPGVSSALVIAGSDKRGTIYGIYDLSEQIGVSPLYWWADVPARHHDELFVKAGKYVQGEPSVKYRGIFINDESPDLTNWVREKYGTAPNLNGVANYGGEFYSHVFEMILRLKGNYLWPAMWNNAFNEDDPANPKLADEFGIVMGTSHQEPMLRAQKEWDRRHRQSWNYYTDAQTLQDFWREGVRRNKDFESIITIGLRGANDTPMIPGGTVPQSMDLLKQIITAQRKIISEEINPDPAKAPQLWCPYKEVLDYYNDGMRVPDDVTILWTDDNWGNLRRLPTPEERSRSGGAGIYYHFDYVGGPRNYKWINTNPIAKVWDQLSQAKAYGADRIWIVNVGHLKGLEFPIEYFFHLAWNTNDPLNRDVNEYTRQWAAKTFEPAYADEIAGIISRYTKYNGRRKPELLEPTTYSQTNYGEADKVVADYKEIVAQAEEVYAKLPSDQRDAFDELVRFPAKACAQVNELYDAVGKNQLYAKQGRAIANDLADQTAAIFKADADLMAYFNHTLGGGKWDHFMDQVHIGYTIWQDPPRNVMPKVVRIQPTTEPSMGVAIDGSDSAWPGATSAAATLVFDAFNQQHRNIDVFNRGQTPFEFAAFTREPWIVLSKSTGSIAKQARLEISIDWTRARKGLGAGVIAISRVGASPPQSVSVNVLSLNPTGITRDSLDGFIESDGCVSIEAEHFTKNTATAESRWEKIDDYGRTLSAMSASPVTVASQTPPNAACLEYKMYLFDSGNVTVQAVVGPTLNFVPGRGLRLAMSFDDQPPQMATIVPENFNAQNGNQEWEKSVKDGCRIVKSPQSLATGGYHTLKVWMVDPGVALEKIVVDLGGVRPSYLGPPESFRGPLTSKNSPPR